jgi:hypothetical protein
MSKTTFVFLAFFLSTNNFGPKVTSFPFIIEHTMHFTQLIFPWSLLNIFSHKKLHCSKFSTRVTTFFWTSPQFEVCIKSYELPKLQKSLLREFRDSQLGNPRRKWHLDVALVTNHKEYYKGGRWWLPPSSNRAESCESVCARGSSVHQKYFNYALINLFVWFM